MILCLLMKLCPFLKQRGGKIKKEMDSSCLHILLLSNRFPSFLLQPSGQSHHGSFPASSSSSSFPLWLSRNRLLSYLNCLFVPLILSYIHILDRLMSRPCDLKSLIYSNEPSISPSFPVLWNTGSVTPPEEVHNKYLQWRNSITEQHCHTQSKYESVKYSISVMCSLNKGWQPHV